MQDREIPLKKSKRIWWLILDVNWKSGTLWVAKTAWFTVLGRGRESFRTTVPEHLPFSWLQKGFYYLFPVFALSIA